MRGTTRTTVTWTRMLFLNYSPWESFSSSSSWDVLSIFSSIKLAIYLFLFLCTYSVPQIFMGNSFHKFTNWIKLYYGRQLTFSGDTSLSKKCVYRYSTLVFKYFFSKSQLVIEYFIYDFANLSSNFVIFFLIIHYFWSQRTNLFVCRSLMHNGLIL